MKRLLSLIGLLLVIVPITALDPQISLNNMTSASKLGFYVNASTEAAGYDAWKAFDGSTADANSWQTPNGIKTGWIRQYIPVSYIATGYRIYSYSNTIVAPKNFTFSGSDDGVTYTVLDTETDQNWALVTEKNYTFLNTHTYNFYNLSVTALYGAGNQLIITELFIYGISQPTITAAFSGTPLSGLAGTTVTFTDESTGYSADNWTWNFGDGNTSTLQNPTHDYDYNGNFNVNLTVYNATAGFDSELKNNYITISDSGGSSGWNRQDIIMQGIYTLTVNYQNSVTHAPIPVVQIIDSNGLNQTTSTGTFVSQYNYSVVVLYASSEGYLSKSSSYLMDEDRTATVYLTAYTPTTSEPPTQTTWYSMQLVRLKIVDAYSNPLEGSHIQVNYIASTLPSTNVSWLISAFGINSAVAEQMTNSSIAMVGNTTNDGSLTFMMFPAITYGLTITNATIGLNNYRTLAPKDTDYVIMCPLAGQVQVNNTLAAVANSSLPYYRLNATGGYNLSMIYYDAQGYTTNLKFQVYDYTHGNILVYNHDLGNPGTSIITDNYTVVVPMGQEYIWQYNATKV